MGLEIEHRSSTSPYVTRVWRATGETPVAEMLIALARRRTNQRVMMALMVTPEDMPKATARAM